MSGRAELQGTEKKGEDDVRNMQEGGTFIVRRRKIRWICD